MSDPRLPGLTGPPGGGLAVGTDLVHVPGLAEQLGQPGTVFAERAFTPRERREAARRSREKGSAQAEHLAARWAAKESFVKAWSQALVLRARATGASAAPVIAPGAVDWRQVEVVSDRWGRPSLHLVGEVADAVEASLGAGSAEPGRWPVSLTHDGNWAAAVVLYTPAW